MVALGEQGCRVFLEIGPSPTLLSMGRRVLGDEASWLPSLRPGRDDWAQMLESLGQLYLAGAPADWAGLDRDYSRRKVWLPTYPFQRERCWVTAKPSQVQARAEVRPATMLHPLLGRRVASAAKGAIFESHLEATSASFLSDHRIYGTVVVPATAYLELGLAAAAHALGAGPHVVENVAISEALVLPAEGGRTVQVNWGAAKIA